MTETCCAKVCTNPGSDDRWHRSYKPCGKTAKFERDGKFYCGTHDPVAREAKQNATRAKWHAEWDRSAREQKFAAAAPAALRQISDGHNDPQALARSVLAILEGGEQ